MRRTLCLIALAALLAGCVRANTSAHQGGPPSELAIGDALLHVEVASTPGARARGLMGRTDLAPDEGMAFVFDALTTDHFWMKDTLIPLSIAFWGETNRVIAILEMQPCRTDPCPTYGPDEPYVGAVEANLGYFAEHGVAIGDRVELTEQAYQ